MSMNPIPDFGPYEEIEKKMLQRIRSKKLDAKILAILQSTYEAELAQRNILLSRPERNRLFRQIVKTVLNDLLGKLGE